MRKLILGLILVCLFATTVFAQESNIRGQITDANGQALPGATIQIKDKLFGAVSDLDGNYVISGEITPEDRIIFSFIGMKQQELQVGGRSTIDIVLEEDAVGLEEIVVVGYGSQKRKNVTGAVAKLNADDLDARPNNQIGSLIQGKAAGVQVLSSSGKPSQGLSIRIRGTNSINAGSEPLYLVDGVPTTDTRSINPSDIDQISILKDAASTAIYGSQGANGVVLITTKRGRKDKATVNFSSYAGVSQAWKTLPVLNGEQYRDLMTEMGQTTDWSLYQENTDWQQEIFQNGVTQNYQLSVSGKNEGTNYYVSGGWISQEGAVRSSKMERANVKLNLDQKVNEWLTVGTSIAYNKYTDVDVKDNETVNQGGVLLGALATPANIGIYNEDGSFTSNPLQNWENPLASTDGLDREYNNEQLLGNVHLAIEFLGDFTFKSRYGIDHSSSIYDSYLDPYRTGYGRALTGQAINNTGQFNYSILENTLGFDHSFGKHQVEALVGNVQQRFRWQNSEIETRNFSSANIPTVNGGSEINRATGTISEKANVSYISRINYSFADKYLLTANFRADGSSVFGPKERWGYFPSFSAGWRLSSESFMENIDLISDLKFRAGWGIVGNDQINNYAWLGKVGSGANYPIGGVAMPGAYPASFQNESLKWEESVQTNVGIDMALFNSRLSFTADYYIKKTNDLLLNAPVPKSTGFDNALQNIGSLENRGYEFSLSSKNLVNSLLWTTDLNVSFNKNEVTDLLGEEIFLGGIAGRGEAILVREGLPLGSLYGYEFGGVDPDTGDAYYIGANGESTFDPTEEDRKVIGDANPDLYFGMTNNLSYKGFGLAVFVQGTLGGDLLNATRIEMEGMTDPKNQSIAVLDRWQQPGDQTDIPRASWASTVNSRISDRFIEDASYIRLKAVTLSYNLPSELLSKVSLGSARIYATAENLYTFTDYSGFDPEVNAFGGSNTEQGIDFGTYPQTRSFILGLNISF